MGLKRLKHERISFFEQADVELAQITLFTRSMLAIYTAIQGA